MATRSRWLTWIALALAGFACKAGDKSKADKVVVPGPEVDAARPVPDVVAGVPTLYEGSVWNPWYEMPKTSYFWTASHDSILIQLVDEDQDGEGVLRATFGGRSQDVTSFTYDTARRGSGFELANLPSGQLEAVFDCGPARQDPGPTYAVLLTWNWVTKQVDIDERWWGNGSEEQPAWDKVGAAAASVDDDDAWLPAEVKQLYRLPALVAGEHYPDCCLDCDPVLPVLETLVASLRKLETESDQASLLAVVSALRNNDIINGNVDIPDAAWPKLTSAMSALAQSFETLALDSTHPDYWALFERDMKFVSAAARELLRHAGELGKASEHYCEND